jgi:hypothetical protein
MKFKVFTGPYNLNRITHPVLICSTYVSFPHLFFQQSRSHHLEDPLLIHSNLIVAEYHQ